MSHTLENALESRLEARIVQIGCSTVLDKVNHQGILYNLSSLGIVMVLQPLSITRGGPMPYMPMLCVSLVSEAGMF